MYSDNEIETAVVNGAIDRDAAERLRAAIAAQRHSSVGDDEQFRLVTGFNDIFVTIAAALVVFATASMLGGIAVAVVSWALAEYFTRQRRMALPSIFLLLCFAGGLFFSLTHLAAAVSLERTSIFPGTGRIRWDQPNATFLVAMAAACAVTAAAVSAHWRRFHVPITIAVVASAVAALAISLVTVLLNAFGLTIPQALNVMPWVAFVAGIVLFAYAMRWDLADPERVTRRADVAFWLHLVAAPMIVHPLYMRLAYLGAGVEGWKLTAALLAILLYVALAAVALVVDRRAVLVSALVYVVIAMGFLMHTTGQVATNVASSGAVIGGLLLALSVFWRNLRGTLLDMVPDHVRARLPRS